MVNKYKEHSCEFVNESACEEELDEEGLEIGKEEREYFEEEGS